MQGVMTVTMHEDLVREVGIPPVLVLVMNLHPVACLEVQSALFATPVLAFVEYHGFYFAWVSGSTSLRPIQPVSIEGASTTLYLRMTHYFRCSMMEQLSVGCGEGVSVPVPPMNGSTAFVLMLSPLPLPQLHGQEVFHPCEGLLRRDVPVVSAPSPNDGVEPAYHLARTLRVAASQDGFQLGKMPLLSLLARRDDGLELKRRSVIVLPGLGSSDIVLTEVEAEEVESG